MVTCSDIFVRTEIVMLLHLWGPRVTYGDKMPVANEFGGMFETQNVSWLGPGKHYVPDMSSL